MQICPVPFRPLSRPRRVAIVHDWLVVYGGAERVLEQILQVFPEADVFSLVDMLAADQRGFLGCREVTTSFIQRLPFARRRYRGYLPLMPLAIEQFDLSGYDLVISSSYAVAKGVLTGPNQLHVCYCHSPIRYAWDLQHQYFREAGLDRGLKRLLAGALMHYMRLWDYRTGAGVDSFVANSQFIARRIRKVYGRDSTVIYPPVDVEAFPLQEHKEDFYLTASRHVPYKKIPMIVAAFNAMPQRRLVVIGDGPELDRVKAAARPNVTVLGYQPFSVLRDHMLRARAFVYGAEEDFGIVPVEAQACGTPVIAFGRGGLLETVREDGVNRTGLFFDEQTSQAVEAAVRAFEALPQPISPAACRANALRFSVEAFRENLREHIDALWESRCGGLRGGAPARQVVPSEMD